MNRFVADASIALTWCFEEEKTAHSEALLDSLSTGAQALVPSLWPYEVLNVLIMAQKNKRISPAEALRCWQYLENLPIFADRSAGQESFIEIMALAEQYHLTAYDAAYLELAARQGLPLATLDADLKKAAKAVGVKLA